MLIDEGLELLSETDCRDLLAAGGLGRVGITIGALPVILPVNYAFVDDHIVFRTGEGTKLHAATMGTIVAFETDSYDTSTHRGWSVLAVGGASRVDADDHIADSVALALKPWNAGPSEYVKIRCEVLTGRRIVALDQA
jgi:uncharacterized protein